MKSLYNRIMLKLSGEVLAGDKGFGLDPKAVDEICAEIVKIAKADVQVAIVVGAGNFWRGRSGGEMNRTTADQMGMLATVMNALALMESIEKQGVPVCVLSALEMAQVCEPYTRRKAVQNLEEGRVVIFAGGTGNPFFSTDTAAALRAAEIEADVCMMAKNVDGVYNADPNKVPDAVKYDEITYMELLRQGLKVIDSTAAAMSLESGIPVLLFALNPPVNISKAVFGEKIGTIIRP